MEKKVQKPLRKLLPDLIRFRQELHRHPELGWQETGTTRRIRRKLESSGIKNISAPLKTGLVVGFEPHQNAPCLLLRADIDALPLPDQKKAEYRSRNVGVCHACGHDFHTTIILGVALVIKEFQREIPVNIKIVFQPAEEPIPSGGKALLKTGILQGVTAAFGLHLEPRLPLGTLSLTPGWVNMQSIRLDIEFSGGGGHSARPSAGTDIIRIATRFIQEAYRQVQPQTDAENRPAILTFTEIEAGEGYNILPRTLKLTGTLRVTCGETREEIQKILHGLAKNLETETGCQIKINSQPGAPPVINDPGLIRQVKSRGLRQFWHSVKIVENFRSPGGDDFGYYAEKVPAAMIRFGIQTGQYRHGLHTSHFDAPSEVIDLAVSFFMNMILNWKEGIS